MKRRSIIFVVATLLFCCWFAEAEVNEEEKQYQGAVQLFNHKDWEAAQAAFQKFEKEYPRSRWKYGTKLRLADLENNPTRAVEIYTEIVKHTEKSTWGIDARWGLATTLFTLGIYQRAYGYLRKVEPKEGLRHAQALYLAALCQMALKNNSRAKSHFITVINKYPSSSWKAPSLVGLGEAELATKNSTAALQAFNSYLDEYPAGDFTNIVLFQKTRVLKNLGEGETANRLLHELVTRYTESFEAEKVKSRLSSDSQSRFTLQVGAFSKPEYAAKLVKRLRKKGYNAYILEARGDETTFSQVRVGNYKTRKFSEEIAGKLKKQENLPYLIIPYEKPGQKK